MSDPAANGPRGSALYIEPARELPLVWLDIEVSGGAAGDPAGVEGFHNHMAELARLGAGALDRERLDTELDALGASLEMSAGRDSVSLSGVCLARNLDRFVDLAADILAAPRMDSGEHERLLRETRYSLDDVRDDDGSLAARFFNHHCVPGHPYARTVLGTESSFDRIELDQVRAAFRRQVVPQNLIIGVAGAVDEAGAVRIAERLTERLPDTAPPPLPAVELGTPPRGRRLLLVDKPDRVQSQVLVGHAGPRYGHADAVPFTMLETIFGGTFTSRLMQEIRVKRGWSYGAGCRLSRGRGNQWFRIHLAPSAETTPDALALTMKLFEDVAGEGISAEELDFGRRYLTGSLAFHLATPQQRMRIAVRNRVFGLPDGFVRELPERFAEVSLDDTRAVAGRWLHPSDALVVVVATADGMSERLHGLWGMAPQVVPFDSY